MEGPRVKAKWLEDRFHNPLPVDAPQALMQKYARLYIVEMLGGTLFMDKGGDWISICKAQIIIIIINQSGSNIDESMTNVRRIVFTTPRLPKVGALMQEWRA